MKHSAALWRVLDTGAQDGPTNMALDEALFTAFNPENSLPILRFYSWHPAALSLGRYQDASADLDLALCAKEGVPVVRRMTGGGIIYHAEELTYSIICTPAQLGRRCGVKDGFRTLCAFLLATYRAFGLAAGFAVDAHPGARLGERTPFCFAGREEYDVVIDGKKLGGNAQRRTRDLIFQHGSIPLRSGVVGGMRFLKTPAPQAESATSLEELGVAPPLADLKKALVANFEEAMGARLEPDTLSPPETAGCSVLMEKYRCNRWNIEAQSQ